MLAVINADSQQVYRQMDIGTAKPSKAQRAKVPHHVIDVVDPDEEFNVARYRELATAAAHDIRSRGKQMIVWWNGSLHQGADAGTVRWPSTRRGNQKSAECRGGRERSPIALPTA